MFRILANGINYARLGQMALRGEVLPVLPTPDGAPPQTVTPPARP